MRGFRYFRLRRAVFGRFVLDFSVSLPGGTIG